MELICPAGTPAALRTAVDAGADAIYCGFADATNARNFPGLNFSRSEMAEGIAYAHRGGAKVLVAINTFPAAGAPALWHLAVDDAIAAGADALIVADVGLIDYAARAHPAQRRRPSRPPIPTRSASMYVISESAAWCCRAFSPSRKLRPSPAPSIVRPRSSSSADCASWRKADARCPLM